MSSTIAALRPKKEPKPHQIESVGFLLANKIAYNLSACGSGKTLPTVLSIKLLWDADAENKILVIAPLSVIRDTWVDHLEEHAPHIPLMLMDESSKRKKNAEKLKDFRGIVLINPDGLVGVHPDMVNWKPGLIVVDELAGYYRNYSTQRFKALRTLKALTRPAMWAFTGTPLTNHIMDSYSQCLLVNPDRMPRKRDGGGIVGYKEFRDILCSQPYPDMWIPKKGAIERVYEIMQPAIRFTREQVMSEIKEPIRLRKTIPMTPEQKKALKDLVDHGKTVYGDAVISATETRALVMKLCQISTGTIYDSKGNDVELPYSPRLEALLDLHVEVEYSPIIVAAPFIHTINRLKRDLTSKGKKVAVIYGDVSPAERREIIQSFQKGELDYLVCHPKTLAHGVTLTTSHTVCWFGPLYDLELYAQLCDRIFRFGQEGQPLIVELCSTEAESKVYASLRNKEQLAIKFLDLFGG